MELIEIIAKIKKDHPEWTDETVLAELPRYQKMMSKKKTALPEIEEPKEEKKPHTLNFEDVIGYEDVKHYLKSKIINRKQTARERELGLKIPKGMLLYGLPGVGKTFFAKALYNELDHDNVVYRIIEADELMDSKVGGSSEKIQNLFKELNVLGRDKLVILVLDEVESIVMKRSGTDTVLAKERTNAMMKAIDGMTDLSNIFVICTSNRPLEIDPAFLRSGRIEEGFQIPYPNEEQRRLLIEKYLGDLEWEVPIDANIIARYTCNFSGSDFNKLRSDLFYMVGEPINLPQAITYITKHNRSLTKRLKEMEEFTKMYKKFEEDGTIMDIKPTGEIRKVNGGN